jgi:hypothetical protein
MQNETQFQQGAERESYRKIITISAVISNFEGKRLAFWNCSHLSRASKSNEIRYWSQWWKYVEKISNLVKIWQKYLSGTSPEDIGRFILLTELWFCSLKIMQTYPTIGLLLKAKYDVQQYTGYRDIDGGASFDHSSKRQDKQCAVRTNGTLRRGLATTGAVEKQ